MLGGCVIVINAVIAIYISCIILVNNNVIIVIVNDTRRWLVNIIVSKILIKTPVSL